MTRLPSRSVAIVPSVLPADFARLGEMVAALEDAGADRIQWDVMDGHFVPNLTFGPDVIRAVRRYVSLPFEAHLMVANPDAMLERYVEAGCGIVIVHAEACLHLHRTLARIGECGARAGVALNPATPLDAVRHVLDSIGLLLVMTVNPGFGGQAYIAAMDAKIRQARRLVDDAELTVDIEVDGGVNATTIACAAAAGATSFVAGSSLFGDARGLRHAVCALRESAAAAIGR